MTNGVDRPPTGGPRAIECSYPQAGVWMFEQIAPGTAAYVDSRLLWLRGPLDHRALRAALDDLVERHDALRTWCRASPSGPVQIVADRGEVDFHFHDLSDRADPEADARRLAQEAASLPLDFERGSLVRVVLSRTGDDRHALLLSTHHTSMDAWSLRVLLDDLGVFYTARLEGRAAALAAPAARYADFAVWQRERWRRGELREAVEYFDRATTAPPPELPYDRARQLRRRYEGSLVREELSEETTASLDRFRRREGAGTLSLLLAALSALLSRYGNSDSVVGAVVRGRERADLERVVGMFVNTLAVRVSADGSDGMRELLGRARGWVEGALAHREAPLDEVLARAKRHGADLLRFVVNYHAFAPLRLAGGGVETERAEMLVRGTPFDLVVHATREGGRLILELEYSAELFEAETARRVLGHLCTLLAAGAERPDLPIGEIDLLSVDERRRVLVEWNRTAVPYPRDATIAELFARQVAASPDAVALACAGRGVTYRELGARATHLGQHLSRLGVGLESRVGVCLERSVEQIVAILAVLEAGGAYVPLAPEYPRPRLARMIDDAGISVVVTVGRFAGRLPEDLAFVCLDEIADALSAEETAGLAPRGWADSLAYVMYTSGSTGTPKGVAVTHRSVVRLVRGANFADLGPDRVFLQLAPMGFDASTLEVWGSLLNGGRLAIAPPGPLDPDEIGEMVEREGITTLWLTAGLFHQVVDGPLAKLRGVGQLLAGGDVLSPSRVAKALTALPDGEVINGYGPTENTTFTCCHSVRDERDLGTGSVPIGRPVSNTRVYILDPELRPTPIGIAGELYAAGDGLARGYVGDAALTADRFVPDPFGRDPGERMYRTGDLARYLADGRIEFLGRCDAQVKVRGHRVEPGEVEAVLRTHPAVREAAVTARPDASGDKRLVAYVVAHDEPPAAADLRAYLEARLPAFMLPSAFVPLPEIPLNENGKVDRRALPEPSSLAPVAEYEPPRNETERLIADVWREVLAVDRVGRRDGFFDLGGHSLFATRIASRLRAALGVDVTVRTLFDHPTVEALARHLGATSTRSAPPTIRRIRPRAE